MHLRLKAIREATKLNQSEFSKKMGLGQSTLAMMEVGKREILDRHIKIICSVFNVDEAWFRTGEGEMFDVSNNSLLEELAEEFKLDGLDKKIIEAYLRLSADDRKSIKKFIVNVAEQSDSAPVVSEVNNLSQTFEDYDLSAPPAMDADDKITAELKKYERSLRSQHRIEHDGVGFFNRSDYSSKNKAK